jgi:hypothetical protein
VTDSLAFQTAQRTPELLGLIADDMRPKLAIRSMSVAILAEPLRQVEDDRLSEEVVLLRQGNERFASLRLDICGIDHRQPSSSEPLPNDLVQKVECVPGGGLIVLIVGDKRSAEV